MVGLLWKCTERILNLFLETKLSGKASGESDFGVGSWHRGPGEEVSAKLMECQNSRL